MKMDVLHDRFDSELLGRTCYKIRITDSAGKPTKASLRDAVTGIPDAESIVLFTAHDPKILAEAHALGFALIGTRNWYVRGLDAPLVETNDELRLIHKAEARERVTSHDLGPLIRTLVTRSRYWKDLSIPRELAVRAYERWFENSLRGDYAEDVIVALWRGAIAGIVTLKRGAAGLIDLIVVNDDAQGRGIGAALIAASVSFCSTQGLSTLVVETEGENVNANRFYQNLGFRTTAHELVFHSQPEQNK